MTTPATHEPTSANGSSPQKKGPEGSRSSGTGARASEVEPVARLRAGAAAAADAIPEAVTRLRGTVDTVAERLPDAVATARTTALETAGSIRALPEPTRRSLAALSIGLGIGLSLAGAPRLLTMAALAPALVSALVMSIEDQPASRAVSA